jgi:hypothetical protein
LSRWSFCVHSNLKEFQVIENLNDLYAFSREFVVDLQRSGQGTLADDIDRALTGGTTSGEILVYLGLAFREVQLEGLGDERVADAVAYMTTVANAARG